MWQKVIMTWFLEQYGIYFSVCFLLHSRYAPTTKPRGVGQGGGNTPKKKQNILPKSFKIMQKKFNFTPPERFQKPVLASWVLRARAQFVQYIKNSKNKYNISLPYHVIITTYFLVKVWNIRIESAKNGKPNASNDRMLIYCGYYNLLSVVSPNKNAFKMSTKRYEKLILRSVLLIVIYFYAE